MLPAPTHGATILVNVDFNPLHPGCPYAMTDAVAVLHGIFQPAFTMLPFCRHLEKEGFSVLNVDYPSTAHPIERLAEIVSPRIYDHAASVGGRLHLVGFSMGGLVIRALLKDRVPVNLGKVVMIGTPNHGSEIADLLKGFGPFRYLYGPAGQQLVTDQKDFASIFANDGMDLGIIAGDNTYNPVVKRLFGQPSDGRVTVESTRLSCAADHLVVHSNHGMLPHNSEVWRQTAAFLTHGCFDHRETWRDHDESHAPLPTIEEVTR